MPLINTYIDLNNNQEWALVNMKSNIQQMFDKMKDHYFAKWLKPTKYTMKWDTNGVISDDCCFKIFENDKCVLIKKTVITRPRVQLISMLLHILIHIYLRACSNGSIKINIHDENFRKIMLFLNETISSEISVSFVIKFLQFFLTIFLLRLSINCCDHRMKLIIQASGTSALESVKTTSHSTEPFVVQRSPMSHNFSGPNMKKIAAVSSLRSLKCLVKILIRVRMI